MGPDDEPPAGTRPGPSLPGSAPGRGDGARPAAIGERVRLLALVALTAALIGLCVLLTVPLLPALTWGVALAILALPMHRRIARRVARPGVAAALTSAAVVVVILVPGLLVTYQLAREAVAFAGRMNESGGVELREEAMPPALGRAMGWVEEATGDVRAEFGRLVQSLTRDAAALARGSVAAVIQALLALYILFYLLRDRAAFLNTMRRLLPMSTEESDLLMERVADSVHANLHAAVVTSLLIAVSGGLMFWWLGLPAPVLWAVVMFLLSILPVAGPVAVWLPAAIFLVASGRWLAASALVAWGVLSAMLVVNVLYARMVGERMRIHDVPTLVAFLGGLVVFGLSGIVLGPAILAVTVAMLEIWRRRLAGGANGSAPSGEV